MEKVHVKLIDENMYCELNSNNVYKGHKKGGKYIYLDCAIEGCHVRSSYNLKTKEIKRLGDHKHTELERKHRIGHILFKKEVRRMAKDRECTFKPYKIFKVVREKYKHIPLYDDFKNQMRNLVKNVRAKALEESDDDGVDNDPENPERIPIDLDVSNPLDNDEIGEDSDKEDESSQTNSPKSVEKQNNDSNSNSKDNASKDLIVLRTNSKVTEKVNESDQEHDDLYELESGFDEGDDDEELSVHVLVSKLFPDANSSDAQKHDFDLRSRSNDKNDDDVVLKDQNHIEPTKSDQPTNHSEENDLGGNQNQVVKPRQSRLKSAMKTGPKSKSSKKAVQFKPSAEGKPTKTKINRRSNCCRHLEFTPRHKEHSIHPA